MDLSINKVFKLLLDKIWIIILIVVLCGTSTYAVSKFLIKPKYESNIEFLVDTSSEGNISELNYAKAIVANYMAIIKSEVFLESICVKLNVLDADVQYKVSDIKNQITVVSSSDATTFVVTLTANSFFEANLICKVIADEGPAILKNFDSLSSSKISYINYPQENLNPISPNVNLNTILGILLGIIIAVSLIVIIDKLDNSIKDEFDLIENYDIPLIGVVYTHKLNKEINGAVK